MAKIGRNQPCPCGSGEKFKRCHGHPDPVAIDIPGLELEFQRAQARRYQREKQQGLGKPIISTQAGTMRFVAVGSGLFYSEKWQTFHDFLIPYLQHTMGKAWWEAEHAKQPSEQHPLMQYTRIASEEAQRHQKTNGTTHTSPMTGAAGAVFTLAYDLYSLEHNAEVQEKLLGRLRNADNFFGARYEVSVAGTLIRSGFTIAFENEDDRNSTHCEFTATHTATGDQFSVEAKRRHGQRNALNKFLVGALRKHALHKRVVFIDANLPDRGVEEGAPGHLDRLFKKLPMMENAKVDGEILPAAYIFVTNFPWEHHLRDTEFRTLILVDGFRIPEFSYRHQAMSLREIIDAREQHRAMHDLIKGMQLYGEIPSTFDGQNPEQAFGPAPPQRMLIGETYEVSDPDGKPARVVLTDAEMLEHEQRAMGAFLFEDGRSALLHLDMTPEEMQAWRRHPETFFGVVKKQHTATTPLELYDFFLDSFRDTPRDIILQRLIGVPDLEPLQDLSDDELRSIYAERTALGAWAIRQDQVS